MNSDRKGYGYAILSATFFACSLVMARLSYDYGTNTQSVLAVRMTLLTLLLLGWNLWRGQSMQLPRHSILACFALGFSSFIGIGSYLYSVAYLPVSLAVLVFYTFPIMVSLISAAIARRWPRPLELLALIIAFVGLVLALDVRLEGVSGFGIFLALLAAFFVAVNMIGSAYLLKNIPTTVLSLYTAIATGFFAIMTVLLTGGLALPDAGDGWWAFSTMLFAFFIAYMSYYGAIRLVGALRSATVMNLEPVATILIAVVVLHETLIGKQLIGGFIVLAAIFLAQWPRLRRLRSRP